MIFVFVTYLLVLFLFGIFDFFRVKKSSTYILANKNSNCFSVTLSLIASVIGASATLGVSSLAAKNGLIAFWWLGAGSIGFLLAAFFLSNFYYSNNAKSLPDLIARYLGKEIVSFSSFLIVVGWIGIVAAQFVAAGKIISAYTTINYNYGVTIIAIVICCYTFMGGVYSSLKIDKIQTFLIFFSIIIVLFFLFKSSVPNIELNDLNILSSSNNITTLIYFFLVVGPGFFIGPDIANRLLTAQNEKVIKKSLFAAAIILVIFSLIITLIGFWVKKSAVDISLSEPLLFAITYVPSFFRYIVIIGLFSAVISSADTCLMTVSTIFSNNIIKNDNIWILRVVTFLIGVVALLLALFVKDILSLLIFAYNVFNGGLIMPMAVSILYRKKAIMNRYFVYAAISVGGLLGITSSILDNKLFAIAAIIISFCFSLLSIKFGKKVEKF